MPGLIGIALAVMVGLLARVVGFDRDRAFYPVVLIVIASYYVLFAIMGGTSAEVVVDLLVFSIFAAMAVLGFRTSLWIVVVALALHGIFDFFRHSMLAGRGVPEWWPTFCLAYDLTAGFGLATLILIESRHSRHGKRTNPDLPHGSANPT